MGEEKNDKNVFVDIPSHNPYLKLTIDPTMRLKGLSFGSQNCIPSFFLMYPQVPYFSLYSNLSYRQICLVSTIYLSLQFGMILLLVSRNYNIWSEVFIWFKPGFLKILPRLS